MFGFLGIFRISKLLIRTNKDVYGSDTGDVNAE